jgi:hypothetical protein
MKDVEHISFIMNYKDGIKIHVDFAYNEPKSLFLVHAFHGQSLELGLLHKIGIDNDETLRDAYIDAFRNLYSYEINFAFNNPLSENILGGLEEELKRGSSTKVKILGKDTKREILNKLVETKINSLIDNLNKSLIKNNKIRKVHHGNRKRNIT